MRAVRYKGWTIPQPFYTHPNVNETPEEFQQREAYWAMWDLDKRCGYGTEVIHIVRYVKRLEAALAASLTPVGTGEDGQ